MGGSGFQFSLGGVSKRSATKPKLAFGLGAAKPKLPVAFAEDSDSDVEGAACTDAQQRTEAGTAATPRLPPPPSDPEVQKVADKLAEFVAKNGRSFESITKERNPGDTPFKFLLDPSCSDYRYYDAKVREFAAAQQGAQPAVAITAPAALQQAAPLQHAEAQPALQQPYTQPTSAVPPLPPQQSWQQGQPHLPPPQQLWQQGQPQHPPPQQSWQQGQAHQQSQQHSHPQGSAMPPPPHGVAPPQPPPWQQAPPPPPPPPQQQQQSAAAEPSAAAPASSAAASPQAAPPQPASSGAGGSAAERKAEQDSLAAMQKFERMAAERERQRRPKEKKVELLNETSYDRRRQVAVTKKDGTRGHHMQDYIPPEELAKLLAAGGDPHSKAAAEALEQQNRISADNVGHRLLSKMGWKEGEGLGASGSGIAAPVAAVGVAGGVDNKRGLGKQEHGAVEEGDDEYALYRKRMQLGYKHRPNPLGNPRKSYY